MGLPDIYPQAGSVAEQCINQNMDYWDIMDAGEYTYNGYRPTEYTAWERERLGWLKIDTLSAPADIELAAIGWRTRLPHTERLRPNRTSTTSWRTCSKRDGTSTYWGTACS